MRNLYRSVIITEILLIAPEGIEMTMLYIGETVLNTS